MLARLGFPQCPSRCMLLFLHEVIDVIVMHVTRSLLGQPETVYKSDGLASSDIFC